MLDGLKTTFAVSGVETWLWLPPSIAFVISFFTSMVGISGAFLLLPLQMSMFHFTSPAVTATNLVYNLLAIPGGVYRYFVEGRLLWPLTLWVVLGTTPGIAIGYFIRVHYLPDPKGFGLFVGAVLSYVGYRLLWRLARADARPIETARPAPDPAVESSLPDIQQGDGVSALRVSPVTVSFDYAGVAHGFHTAGMFLLALVVGIVGGIYGIGGGALIAPFCVSLFHLPIHAIAGATLAATFFSSLIGVLFYQWMPAPAGVSIRPDWALGLLFGLGGFAGTYLGARAQRYLPQRLLELLLSLLLIFLGLKYVFFGY